MAFFARALPALRWQPSDAYARAPGQHPRLERRIRRRQHRAALTLDVERQPWPVTHADAILNINMIHIAPWSATGALFEGAARILAPGGVLFLYGPFTRDGQHTAESNQRFDERLRGEDPRWGVRDLADVERVANAAGFLSSEVVPMPANNLSLVFRRSAAPG